MDRPTPRLGGGHYTSLGGRKGVYTAGRSRFCPAGRKGFYLVSPFLGFFFFLITVGIAAFFITENQQSIETSKAGSTHALIFTSYAIQADAFDVYFQNYLQSILDNYTITSATGQPSDPALITELENRTNMALASNVKKTYTQVYSDGFGIDCTTGEKMWSLALVSFHKQRGTYVLDWPAGSGEMWMDGFFSPDQRTAAWPLISRYSLECTMKEPPMTSDIELSSRWYYLDAQCICCQVPQACGLGDTMQPMPFEACPCTQPQRRSGYTHG